MLLNLPERTLERLQSIANLECAMAMLMGAIDERKAKALAEAREALDDPEITLDYLMCAAAQQNEGKPRNNLIVFPKVASA